MNIPPSFGEKLEEVEYRQEGDYLILRAQREPGDGGHIQFSDEFLDSEGKVDSEFLTNNILKQLQSGEDRIEVEVPQEYEVDVRDNVREEIYWSYRPLLIRYQVMEYDETNLGCELSVEASAEEAIASYIHDSSHIIHSNLPPELSSESDTPILQPPLEERRNAINLLGSFNRGRMATVFDEMERGSFTPAFRTLMIVGEIQRILDYAEDFAHSLYSIHHGSEEQEEIEELSRDFQTVFREPERIGLQI
ncbi:MAG: hypothetical protein ABEJ72_05580, partial [Candidatus Aenigmatarchaeota archaeon]